MTQRDRYILIVVGVVALLGAYWFLALAPKRDQVSKLDKDLAAAQQSLSQAKQEKAQFAQAQVEFPVLYASLGRLGKAVPAGEQVPSLLVQLNHAAAQANVDFRSVELKVDSSNQSASAGPTSATPPATGATGASGAAATATAGGGSGAAPATLEPLPFEYKFKGDFYRLTDLISNVTRLVRERNDQLAISGRLVVIDGFALTRHKVTLVASSYMLPADQALFAGATPAGPSAAAGATQQAASPPPAASTPTASVTAP